MSDIRAVWHLKLDMRGMAFELDLMAGGLGCCPDQSVVVVVVVAWCYVHI